MGFLMMLARQIQLQDRKNNLEFQITKLNEQKDEMISYASILAQDSVTLSDISSLPSSLFSQGMTELMNAHYQAMNISQAQFAQAMSSGMFGDGSNVQLQQIAQQKMYENARKQIQKMMQMKLNEQEKKTAAKAARLQAELTQIEQELQAVSEREAKDIQTSTCTYGLRA